MENSLLKALAGADAVSLDNTGFGDSPILTSFPTEPEDGEIEFTWEDQEGQYFCTIPEENLNSFIHDERGFTVKDEDDNEVTILPYKLAPLWR